MARPEIDLDTFGGTNRCHDLVEALNKRGDAKLSKKVLRAVNVCMEDFKTITEFPDPLRNVLWRGILRVSHRTIDVDDIDDEDGSSNLDWKLKQVIQEFSDEVICTRVGKMDLIPENDVVERLAMQDAFRILSVALENHPSLKQEIVDLFVTFLSGHHYLTTIRASGPRKRLLERWKEHYLLLTEKPPIGVKNSIQTQLEAAKIKYSLFRNVLITRHRQAVRNGETYERLAYW